MAIDGIHHKSAEGYNVFYVDTLSEHLIDILRADLASICYGPRLADSTRLHSYKGTIKEFYLRYSKASDKTKTGVLGELLAHVIIRHSMPEMKPISILLNPNERSIKKGFDVNFIRHSEIWYGEVKSSRAKTSIGAKNKNLLIKAKVALEKNFNNDELRLSLWTGAINEAAIMFDSVPLQPIRDLLDGSLGQIEENSATAANAVLISVPFHDRSTGEINESEVREYLAECLGEKTFKNVTLICIQKSLFSALEAFIKSEAENA